MTAGEPFVDYYKILQLSQQSDKRSIRAAYRDLAKRYHPDHPETADIDKFNGVIEAYRTLGRAESRAEYDLLYFANGSGPESSPAFDEPGSDLSPLTDAEAHSLILDALYKRRREHAQDPGVIGFYVQRMLRCADNHFDFHVWYLKAKGLIETTEQGTLVITILGVDHVISMAQTMRKEKLLISQLNI